MQVLYGVPKGKEDEAHVLRQNINNGLRGVLGAIDAKCVPTSLPVHSVSSCTSKIELVSYRLNTLQ
jgi:hypothetical protein